jgi:hypothetical protein
MDRRTRLALLIYVQQLTGKLIESASFRSIQQPTYFDLVTNWEVDDLGLANNTFLEE